MERAVERTGNKFRRADLCDALQQFHFFSTGFIEASSWLKFFHYIFIVFAFSAIKMFEYVEFSREGEGFRLAGEFVESLTLRWLFRCNENLTECFE